MDRVKLKVSIVVPVYNVSLYIERSVKSVMAQTYPVLECIIVDDASPDDSIAKCERLIARYDGPTRYVILHHEQNRGLSAARNTGTVAALGDYVFYLDSDDEITPDCIEKLAKPIERNASIEMVVGNFQVLSKIPSKGRVSFEEEFTSSAAVRECFFDKNVLPVVAWNKLMSKKFLMNNGLLFMEGILCEDILWTFYVVKCLQRLYVIPVITYNYYKRSSSITTRTDKSEMADHLSIIYEEIARHFTPGEEAREAKYYLDFYFRLFKKNRRMESFKRALPLFESVLASDEYRKERLRLWVLRHSSKLSFLRWMLAILLRFRAALLYPLRRLAFFCKKAKL